MEVWKDIPDYQGLYQVSNLGNVKSLRFNKERILSPRQSKGYYLVGLCLNNKRKTMGIHQLVAIAFLNHIPNGHKIIVDHINDIKTDNRVENLQVITQRENSYKTQGNYSSKYKGVNWHKAASKWRSSVRINGKTIHLGLFNCELAAHLAYQNKLKEIIL